MPNNLNVEEQVILALRRISRAVDIHSSFLQRAFGLTGPQLTALRMAKTLQPVSAGVLARNANIGYATLTGILDRLEKQGFVVRARDESDRRTVIVTVTPAGERVLAKAPSLLQNRLRQELARIPAREREDLLQALVRVALLMEADLTAGAAPEGPERLEPANSRLSGVSKARSVATVPGR
jgi:DNA-binding MarR family transcriptional regulator